MSFSIGPIAFPFAPFWLLLLYWLAMWQVARWVGAERAQVAKDHLQAALWAALIGSRFVFLAMHATLYVDNPWAVFDIRDAGWHAPAGVAIGAAWLGWRMRQHADLHRPVWQLSVLAVILWFGGTWWAEQRVAQAMPAVAVESLEQSQPQALNTLLDGRPVVVNLWATWCGPCRQEMPALAQAQQDNPHIRFVFVNQGEDAAHVEQFIAQQGWILKDMWLDAKAQTGKSVGSQSLPTTMFYDAQGQLVRAHVGVLTPIAIRAQLLQMATVKDR